MAILHEDLRIQVMADYGSSGIWALPPSRGMVRYEQIHLPNDLVRDFVKWIEWFWIAQYDELDFAPFNSEGYTLALHLKRFLGEDVYVEYWPYTERGGGTAIPVLIDLPLF